MLKLMTHMFGGLGMTWPINHHSIRLPLSYKFLDTNITQHHTNGKPTSHQHHNNITHTNINN